MGMSMDSMSIMSMSMSMSMSSMSGMTHRPKPKCKEGVEKEQTAVLFDSDCLEKNKLMGRH
jgi:hypothetical protein